MSVDLDFFGSVNVDDDTLLEELRTAGHVTGFRHVSPKIRFCLIDDIKVDIVDYSMYPWIDNAVIEGPIRLASASDVAQDI